MSTFVDDQSQRIVVRISRPSCSQLRDGSKAARAGQTRALLRGRIPVYAPSAMSSHRLLRLCGCETPKLRVDPVPEVGRAIGDPLDLVPGDHRGPELPDRPPPVPDAGSVVPPELAAPERLPVAAGARAVATPCAVAARSGRCPRRE